MGEKSDVLRAFALFAHSHQSTNRAGTQMQQGTSLTIKGIMDGPDRPKLQEALQATFALAGDAGNAVEIKFEDEPCQGVPHVLIDNVSDAVVVSFNQAIRGAFHASGLDQPRITANFTYNPDWVGVPIGTSGCGL